MRAQRVLIAKPLANRENEPSLYAWFMLRDYTRAMAGLDAAIKLNPNYVNADRFFSFVLEPLIQFGKLAVVEVSLRDANAIDVAAGLVEANEGLTRTNSGASPCAYGESISRLLAKAFK